MGDPRSLITDYGGLTTDYYAIILHDNHEVRHNET